MTTYPKTDAATALEARLDEADVRPQYAAPPPPEPETTTGSTAATGSTSERWAMPRPLPRYELTPVLPYTPDMVPKTLRPWLEDVAERGNFCFDYLAVGAVAALGAAIGSKCAIYPKRQDDWCEVPNLWGGIVGRPGMMKSPSMSAALAPLRQVANQWQTEHTEALATFEVEKKKRAFLAKIKKSEMLEAAKKAIKAGSSNFDLPEEEEDEAPPTPRRLITSDATKEKLADLLIRNPAGLLVEQDELVALFVAIEDDGGLREFLLKSWNGMQSHNVDRVGRGELFVPCACVSVFGGIQPGRIAPLVRRSMRGGAGSDGWLSRYQLLAFPDGFNDEWKLVDRWPDHDAKRLACEVYSKLANASPDQFPNANQYGRPGLRFDAEAQDHFFGWLENFQRRLRAGAEKDAIAEVLNKWRKLVPALALIFELAENPFSTEVGAEALGLAFRWADVIETHQHRLYDCGNSDLDAAQRIAKRIRKGNLARDGFSARDIQVKGWSGLNDAESVHSALELLEDYGWIVAEAKATGPKGGRPSRIFIANPLADGLPIE